MSRVFREVRVTGTVQGVGFRPFIYRLADSLGLSGWASNRPEGVVIALAGPPDAIEEFVRRLPREAPPLARIRSLAVSELPPFEAADFSIRESAVGPAPTALIPPDVALCEDCARELRDPADRRWGYAFTNCTNCGPRFTIVRGIPYDRPQTTMAQFAMCRDCAAEYRNPTDRRFHAEPIACPSCGPTLSFDGEVVPDAIARAARRLAEGRIVAIKGLGGYHLACDARNQGAVETLRARKGRGLKPFAIMVRDLAEARRVAQVSPRAAALLASRESPVVILPACAEGGLAPGIAPRQRTVGVMLPYTPLHRLLLDQAPPALVMTSGNLAEEPIAHQEDEARRRLGTIADHFLSHNRDIAVPCDDSVVRVAGDLAILVRRARGYVPRAVPVGISGPPILAVGGHHKNTFCLLREGEAILSQHIGDLDSLEVLEYYARAIAHFARLFQVTPEVVAHDIHPGYLSTQHARSLPGVRLIPVAHHHAHVASVMAERGLAGPVIGVAYDGTGLGPDGTLWGGEVLVGDLRDFRRAFHLRPTPLPGGERAIAHPSRMTFSFLLSAWGDEALAIACRLLPRLGGPELRVLPRQLARGVNCPLTSSMGRLFDAVAALLGATEPTSYEGQPAMELEAMAEESEVADQAYPYLMNDGVVDTRPLFRALAADLEQGLPPAVCAARFHETVAAFTVEACRRVREEGGPREVVLAGGVMQNARLVARLQAGLEAAGLKPYTHLEVPPNDGGLSLGQAAIAAARSVG